MRRPVKMSPVWKAEMAVAHQRLQVLLRNVPANHEESKGDEDTSSQQLVAELESMPEDIQAAADAMVLLSSYLDVNFPGVPG